MKKLPILKEYREQAALSQMELAQAAGISRSTVEELEGGRTAQGQTTRALAGVLGVEPKELMASATATPEKV